MAVKIIPRGDRVLVKLVDFDVEEKEVDLYVPDVSREAPDKGEIVDVGPGRLLPDGTRLSMESEVGQLVLFGQYSGMPAGKEYHLVREEEILATVEGATVKELEPHPLREGRDVGGGEQLIHTVTPQMISPRVK